MSLPTAIKDLFSGANSRISNPLTFTFLAAFFVYNWEPIIILVFDSSISIPERIAYFKKYRENVLGYIFWPLILAASFCIFYPMLNSLLDLWNDYVWVLRDKALKEIKKDAFVPAQKLDDLKEQLRSANFQIDGLERSEAEYKKTILKIRVFSRISGYKSLNKGRSPLAARLNPALAARQAGPVTDLPLG